LNYNSKQILGNLVEYVAKGIPPKYTDNENENTILVLNQKTNRNFRINFELARLNDTTKKRVAEEKILKKYDILINSTGVGTAGRIAQLGNIHRKMTVDGHMVIVRANASKIDPLYLGYALKAQQKAIEGLQEGSTGQTELNRQRLLNEIVVEFPVSLELQREIGNLFRAIDDRIDLNGKINHHLEQMAQAIFKSWFVDFEPWGGVMPSDWSTGNLLDIADYLNGLAMQRFRPVEGEVGLPVLKIKELRQGRCDKSSELCSPNIRADYIVRDGDVIFSWSGSLLVDFWCGGDCGLNQHLFKVTSTKYDKWFYYAWTRHHLEQFIAIAADKATTMGHIKRENLKNAEVLIPSTKNYAAAGELLAPIYEKFIGIRLESARLATLRDTLLPRLMSGELSVADLAAK